MKNHFYTYVFLVGIVSFCCSKIQAQYLGGTGEGSSKNSTIQLTLNGAAINTVGLYQGGIGDGNDKAEFLTTLSGTVIAAIYMGGNGDGHDKESVTITLSGAKLLALYGGGDGDGQDKSEFAGVTTGEEIAQLYKGGDGDGHDKSIFAGVLSGEEIAQLYEGGIGDGHDKSSFAGVVSGEEIAQLYLGGIGDGHDKNLYAGVLDGEALAALYSGGIGDGFAKQSIEYIFDFPGCTFVVNTDNDGFGSLRYAINCAMPGDTIEFSPLLMNNTIDLTSSAIEVEKDIYIDTDRAAGITLDANQVDRAFEIEPTHLVSIKGLRIIVGMEANGGAVLNNGTLTLIDLDIIDPTNNSTTVVRTTLSGTLRIRGQVNIMEN